jgi:hypothetical protein
MRRMQMTLIAIDPGIDGTGIACFDDMDIRRYGLYFAEVWTRPAHLDWQSVAASLAWKLDNLVSTYGMHCGVVCEWPRYFTGAVGQAATAKGDIHKLSYLIGQFGLVCKMHYINMQLVPVNDWKGQLPKATIERRILRVIGAEHCKSLGLKDHAFDAVGIGMYAKGHRFDSSARTTDS